jgi:diacylglycerol kinase (ATP)
MAAVAILLPLTAVEKVLLIGSLLLVLIVELLNTAIEVAVDRDSVRIDPLGKRAKDYGSAAVTIVLLIAGMTWVTILGSHYL